MATQRKSWLPREGFTLDVVRTLVNQTVLNPTLTLPLWLATQYTLRGQGAAIDHPVAVRRLRALVGLGLLRLFNGWLNQASQNNWTRTRGPDWSRELVLITGGSDGFGKILTRMFAARGVRVVMLDVQEPTYELPPSVNFLKVDLSDPVAIVQTSAQVRQLYGDPSVLLLNAGVCNRHTILNTPDELLQRLFAVNALAHHRLAREFVPAMVAANHGLVCTTASLAAFVTVAGMADYASSKAAALAFHEALTQELQHRYDAPGVRTLCVCPNFARTRLTDGFRNDSTFAAPTMAPETVAEAQFERIWNWQGGVIPVPPTGAWLAMNLRSLPYWLQNAVRGQLRHVMSGPEAAEQERVRKLVDEAERASRSVVEVVREEATATSEKEEMFG